MKHFTYLCTQKEHNETNNTALRPSDSESFPKDGKASGVTSVAFVKRHALKSPSSVQFAISALLEKQLLTYQDEERTKVYSVADKFMEMWLYSIY